MPYLRTGREVVVGSICRDRTFADVEVMCADHMPAHRSSPLFVEVRFRENTEGKVKLTLARAAGSGGDARFDSGTGPAEREFTGGIRQVLWVFGTAASVGEAPDVNLTVHIEDELVATIPLFIGPPVSRVRIRNQEGGRPPTRVTEATTLRASVRPEDTAGTYRWVSVHADALAIVGDATREEVSVEPRGDAGAQRALAVLFTPTLGPATMALHTFGAAGVEVRSAYWTKGLRPTGTGPVRAGEILEALVTIERSRTCLDAATAARLFIIEDDNFFFGGRDDRIVALLGTGAAAPTEPYRTERRTTTFRTMTADETLDDAVADFRAFHSGDFWEHLLLLEQTQEDGERTYHVVVWWPAVHVSDVAGNPEYYFVLDLAGQRIESPDSESVEVESTAVDPPEIPQRVRLRVTGTALDAHPFNPATPEPVRAAEVRGGGVAVRTGADGRFTLEGFFALGAAPQPVELRRPGMTTLRLSFAVALAGGQVSVTVNDAAGARLVTLSVPRPASERVPIDVALPALRLTVHKLRGEITWPDSRTLDDPDYRGTPLAGKHVYALPLAEGEITPQRPPDSRTWAAWKSRPGVVKSGRPGRAAEGERTAHNGQFELAFIELTVGKRYFLWVESAATGSDVDSPEYAVRTHYALLRELTGSQANLAVDVGRHLIDHVYNLTRDAVEWGVEAIKVVDWTLDTGGSEERVLRPQRDAKDAFETLVASGERVTFDPATRIAEGFRIQALPLVPIDETRDAQSDHARSARTPIEEALDVAFARGHVGDARWALDSSRIADAIDLSAGVWDAAWNAGDVAASRGRRICELLEKSFVLSTGIPSPHIARIEDVRWRFDAITLADGGLISIPAAPAAQAVAANRRLDTAWVPALAAFSPRLLGLSAGRHMLLAPGHGFYDANAPSVALADWRSQRGSYNLRAGEDENVGYMSSEVDRIARRQGMTVTSVREIRDFTAPGVVHPANNVFNPSPNRDFLRLWQQNPIYALGTAGHPVVIGTALGNLAGDHNGMGITARWQLATQLAGAAAPIDIMLAVHTNAGGGRGASALYLDVETSTANAAEFNTMGLDFATRLRDQLVAHAHLQARAVLSLRALNLPAAPAARSGNGDLQNTFDHWEQNIGGSSSVWPRVRAAPVPAAGWNHRAFPRTIPVALVEVAFHDHVEDAALLVRGWFRRLAGEAMAFAVEQQLRDEPAAITRADMVSMLTACFGPTARVRALVSDGTPIAGDVGAYVAAATGEPAPVAANDLGSAVAAVEAARDAYTRQAFVTALRDALAAIAGYGAGDAAEIERFVAGAIVDDDTGMAALRRGARPPLRGEAAVLIATALGWTPANLATVETRDVGPRPQAPLIAPLADGAAAERYLPRAEAADILARLATLTAEEIYRITKLSLTLADGTAVDRVRGGTRVAIVAETAGVPWHSPLADTRFVLSAAGGFSLEVPLVRRERGKLVSDTFEYPASGVEPRVIHVIVRVRHSARGNLDLGARDLRICTVL